MQWVDGEVLQADGETRCATSTGACVALARGSARLEREKAFDGPVLRDQVGNFAST